MLSIITVAIVFGSLIALATLICGTVLVIIKTRRSNRGAGDSEETRIIQELYQNLERMEERIESLETILAESQEKEGYKK
ncbi:MAG: phage-shock protein [Pseudomonadota bacterium]